MDVQEMCARDFMTLGIESEKFDAAMKRILAEFQLVDAVDEILLIAERYKIEVDRAELIDFLIDCAEEAADLPDYEKLGLRGDEPEPADHHLLGYIYFKKTNGGDAANSNESAARDSSLYYLSLSR